MKLKQKMVQEQWLQLKRVFLFFIRLNWLSMGGNKNMVGRGWMSKLTMYKPCQQVSIYNKEALCTSRTSCAKVAILLLQDLSTLCVTDIYGVYFHFFKTVVIIMCDFFQVIKNTFFCYANISQPSRIHKMFIFHTHCFQKY